VLAPHCESTEKELDFIINYDIEYRLGRDPGLIPKTPRFSAWPMLGMRDVANVKRLARPTRFGLSLVGFGTMPAQTSKYLGEEMPTEAVKLQELSGPSHADALEWMSLANEALPNSKPLSTEERASINEFF